MARASRISQSLIDNAMKAVTEASTISELRAAQAVILPGLFKMTLPQTGQIIGKSRSTVIRLQKNFKVSHTGENIPKERREWGGRRYGYLTIKEEKNLLAGFFEEASQGGVLVVGRVKKAFEEKIGHKVAKTTTYRMLARHGWRKIAPRRRHPGRDMEKQEAFKKTA
jgi:transposase